MDDYDHLMAGGFQDVPRRTYDDGPGMIPCRVEAVERLVWGIIGLPRF
jgi:hypothetical protein